MIHEAPRGKAEQRLVLVGFTSLPDTAGAFLELLRGASRHIYMYIHTINSKLTLPLLSLLKIIDCLKNPSEQE